MNIRSLISVNYYKSFRANVRLKFRVFPKVHLRIDKDSKVEISNKVNIGNSWPQLGYYESQFKIAPGGVFKVTGDFNIFSGLLISVNEDAELILGSGYINYRSNIACFNKITIGDDVAISENVTIRDSDNHYIYKKGYEISKPINIGNHVWVGMNATILKGVTIGDGAIIAAGSIVTRNVPAHCLVAGIPARIIHENIKWGNEQI